MATLTGSAKGCKVQLNWLENDCNSGSITQSTGVCFLKTCDNDVTPLSGIPQGTIWENHCKSTSQFNPIP